MKSVISNLFTLQASKIVKTAVLLATLPLIFTFSNASVAQEDEEEGRRAPPAARSAQTLSRPVYQRT